MPGFSPQKKKRLTVPASPSPAKKKRSEQHETVKIDLTQESTKEKKYVTTEWYNGKRQVNLRKYFNKDGEYCPTKKGIVLDVEQWSNLVKHSQIVSEALEAEGSDPVGLGGSRKVSVQ